MNLQLTLLLAYDMFPVIYAELAAFWSPFQQTVCEKFQIAREKVVVTVTPTFKSGGDMSHPTFKSGGDISLPSHTKLRLCSSSRSRRPSLSFVIKHGTNKLGIGLHFNKNCIILALAVFICPIHVAITYSYGTDNKIGLRLSVCVSVCLSVCPCVITLTVAFLCRFSPNLTQRCKRTNIRTSSLGVNIAPPLPLFYP